MPFNNLLRGLACAIPLALAACGGDPTPFELELLTTDCDGTSTSVIPSTGTITVTVSGEGMSDVSESANLASHSLALPEVPVGRARIATVEVRDAGGGQGTAGSLQAVGTSAPFDVSEEGTPKVTVPLYRVNGFTFTRASRDGCSSLETPRAGHTATRLQDGRVLIAGGYQAEGEGRVYLSSAEIFDPGTSTFQTVAPICAGGDCWEVAHAKGALLRDGRVVIVGGEEEGVSASSRAAVYDPESDSWTLDAELEIGRRGHTATLLNTTGAVLVIGGVDEEGQVVSTVEVFNPEAGSFEVALSSGGDPISLPRAYHGAAPTGLAAVQVAGGIDGEGELPRSSLAVNWHQPSGSYNRTEPVTALESGGRVGAGFVPFSDAYFAVVGGASSWSSEEGTPGLGTASNTSEQVQWFEGARGTRRRNVAGMSRQRFEPCTAPIDQTRALVVGGFSAPGTQPLATSELLAFVSSDGAPPEMTTELPRGGALKETGGRGHGSCTALEDGSVLMVGGLRVNGSVTASAEIYVPQRPQD